MNRFNKAVGLILVSIFFFQCQKDLSYIGNSDPGISVVISPDPIKANLQGNILDENNQPVAGVTITVGTMTAITNPTGYFRINDASLDKNTSLVTAEKAGYFKGYRVFSATTGSNQVVIKLTKKSLAATITASSGGNATLANGAIISLPANSVVVASSGSPYSGDVKVYASYINPTASDIAETVPGSFMANDKNGNRVALESFGMLAVELESAGGEKLQIKSDAVATLTSPIPASAIATAPATIALWYVDEQTGIWKEEGSATKQGNNYVGDVKHFSYWNCDYPFAAISISVTFHNADGLPLANVPVRITPEDGGGAAHGFTDSLGQVKGLVPADKNLLLEVLDPCGNAVYTQRLTPLTQNTDLGIITVSGGTASFVTFSGTLLDCGGLPVTDGYAIISFNNIIRYAATDSNGEYATTLVTCSGTAGISKVLGVDQAAQQQSATSSVNVIAPVTNAGNITACGTSSAQYINYTLDGTDYNITTAVNDSIVAFGRSQGSSSYVIIMGSQKVNFTNHISFVARDASAIGTFPVGEVGLQNYHSIILTQPFNVTFTSFATSAGEFYEGTLAGQFTADSTTTIHNISSTFRVRRNN